MMKNNYLKVKSYLKQLILFINSEFDNIINIFLFVNMLTENKNVKEKNMHQPGIEPGSKRWQRSILPLND